MNGKIRSNIASLAYQVDQAETIMNQVNLIVQV